MQIKSNALSLPEIDAAHDAAGEMWHEFLRVPDLSMGLYVIPAGGEDLQSPHQEDEVYCVLSGKGMLTTAEREYPAEAGTILYVAKHVPHRFHSISEEIRVLVFFAPAHTT